MALPRRARLVLRLAGAACLVAGLFPYYSHTAGPPAGAGVPPTEPPIVGALPDRPSTTTVRLGLPFSPLFRSHREDRFTAERTSGPATGGGVTGKSGETTSAGEVTTTSFRSGFSFSWRVEFLSWSAAAVATGVVLLVVSSPRGGRRPVVPPAAEAGPGG